MALEVLWTHDLCPTVEKLDDRPLRLVLLDAAGRQISFYISAGRSMGPFLLGRAWLTGEQRTAMDGCEDRRLYIGSISASPTACLLRGYGRVGTQNDRLAEAVNLSTSGNAEMGPI